MRKFKSKKLNKKPLILVLILCISIGFAMLTANLSINGSFAFRNHTFDVHFDNIELDEESISDVGPTLDSSKTNMSFSVNLSQPEDFYKFKFDVVNSGDVDAMINKIEVTGIPSELSDIVDYELLYYNDREVKQYHTLTAGQTVNMKFKIYYKDITIDQIPESSYNLDLGINIEFVLPDDNAIRLGVATFDTGQNVDVKMKTLSGQSSATIHTTDSLIKGIKRADTLSITPTDDNIVSVSNSDYPIYMWFEEDTVAGDGTGDIYWYTDSFFVELNYNSSRFFYYIKKLSDIDSISVWNPRYVVNINSMFSGCSDISDFSPISDWNIGSVKDMSYLFSSTSISDTNALSNWNTKNVEDMSELFRFCNSLTNLEGLSNWNTTNVSAIKNIFADCIILEDIEPLRNWNVSQVYDMRWVFDGCKKLSNISALSEWNTSSVEYFNLMFYQSAINDLSPIANWNLSSVIQMYDMFGNCKNITSLVPLSNWNVSGVSNISSLFYSCSGITDLTPLNNWNVSNVTDMSSAFSDCSGITDLSPLNNWNVSSVTNMSRLFYDCDGITDLSPLSNWTTNSLENMSYIFYSCSGITDLNPLSNWNVSGVKNMSYAFNGCYGLSDLTPLSNWNVSSVTTTKRMFWSCTNIYDASCLNGWNVSSLTDYSMMFEPSVTTKPSWYV